MMRAITRTFGGRCAATVAKSRVMDIAPHLACGVVTAVVHDDLLSR